jgi:hypothetical protein
MSLQGFIQLIDDNIEFDLVQNYVYKYKEKLLKCLDDNHPYTTILKYFFTKNLSDFIKSNLPWKLIQNFYFNFRKTDTLTIQDLENDRMTDVINDSMYFSILNTFLKDHEIVEIPESFIKHYELFTQCFFIDGICRFIKSDRLIDDSLLKYINLLILFLDRFDINCIKHFYQIKKDKLHIYYNLETYFELNNNSDTAYMYHNEIVTQDNIIGFCLNSIKNRDLQFGHDRIINFMNNLTNYFEYMHMDEQIEFWNILIDIKKYYSVNDIIEFLFTSTESDIFMDYAFNNYEKLKSEHDVYEIISDGKIYQPLFYKNVLTLYPQTRNTLIINLMFMNIVC